MPANTPYPNETDAQFRARQQQQGQYAPTHRGVVDSPGAKRRRGRRPRKQMTYTPTVAPTAVGPAANMAAHTALTQERDAAKMQGEQNAAFQAQIKDLETQLAESQQGYQDLQGRYQGVMDHEVDLGGYGDWTRQGLRRKYKLEGGDLAGDDYQAQKFRAFQDWSKGDNREKTYGDWVGGGLQGYAPVAYTPPAPAVEAPVADAPVAAAPPVEAPPPAPVAGAPTQPANPWANMSPEALAGLRNWRQMLNERETYTPPPPPPAPTAPAAGAPAPEAQEGESQMVDDSPAPEAERRVRDNMFIDEDGNGIDDRDPGGVTGPLRPRPSLPIPPGPPGELIPPPQPLRPGRPGRRRLGSPIRGIAPGELIPTPGMIRGPGGAEIPVRYGPPGRPSLPPGMIPTPDIGLLRPSLPPEKIRTPNPDITLEEWLENRPGILQRPGRPSYRPSNPGVDYQLLGSHYGQYGLGDLLGARNTLRPYRRNRFR